MLLFALCADYVNSLAIIIRAQRMSLPSLCAYAEIQRLHSRGRNEIRRGQQRAQPETFTTRHSQKQPQPTTATDSKTKEA